MGSIKKNLITTTTTTTKQNKTHAYFPIYSLSLIFKVTARAACLLTYLLSAYFSTFYRTLCISQFQLRPAPPPLSPLGYCRALAHLFSPGVGHLQISRCSGAGHLTSPGLFPALDTHAVSCQHITTQRILLEKNADWFICQGQGLVKACSQFYVRIFYGLSSQNYTTRNRELLT